MFTASMQEIIVTVDKFDPYVLILMDLPFMLKERVSTDYLRDRFLCSHTVASPLTRDGIQIAILKVKIKRSKTGTIKGK